MGEKSRAHWAYSFKGRASQPPPVEPGKDWSCGTCGGSFQIGAWPFCAGNPEDHAR
jgi:hypothetical protein